MKRIVKKIVVKDGKRSLEWVVSSLPTTLSPEEREKRRGELRRDMIRELRGESLTKYKEIRAKLSEARALEVGVNCTATSRKNKIKKYNRQVTKLLESVYGVDLRLNEKEEV